MLAYIRKLVLVLGTAALLLAVTLYGVYHLGTAYISNELDSLLDQLATTQLPEVGRQHLDDSGTPSPITNSTQPGDQYTAPEDAEPPSRVSVPNTSAAIPKQTASGTTAGSPTNRAAQAGAMVSADNITQTLAGLGLTKAERQHAESLLPLIGKMSLQEKLFALQCIRKFTLSELVQMFRWYRQGDGTAVERIKQRFYERFSAEDIERILQIADKYR